MHLTADSTASNLAGVRAMFPDRVPHLPAFEACALLDYPLHPNPGDHMLFLAALLWLNRQCDASKIYIAHRLNFSKEELTRKIGDNPIFCVGGGNLGDLWPNPQRFREDVVRTCDTQPITLLPQCMYFRKAQSLERARSVFNAHSRLTIMLRDPVSMDLAQKYFTSRNMLTPDQSVLLADVITPRPPSAGQDAFFLRRGIRDPEAAPDLPKFLQVASMPAGNWDSMGPSGFLSGVRVFLNGGRSPARSLPADMPRSLCDVTRKVHRPRYVVRSWQIVRHSMNQIDRYAVVVTDRFHGHLLCALRNIPHVVVGNNHHKVQAHWERWMRGVRGSAFARSPADLPEAMAHATAAG